MNYSQKFSGAGYTAPEVSTYSVKVETGFSSSLPGVTINPWESDDDSLEF